MNRVSKLAALLALILLLLTGVAVADTVLPGDLTVIGEEAFRSDVSLTGTLTIPEGVTEIGPRAFDGCSGLTSLILPESVRTISTRAFADCSSLTGTLYIDADVDLAEDAFDGCGSLKVVVVTPVRCFTYTNTGTAIMLGSYVGGNEFANVVIPPMIEGLPVMMIQNQAFAGCTAVESVVIPEGVTYIGANAFDRCTGLTRVALPESLLHMDANAFAGCTALTAVHIPAKLASVGGNPFAGCTSLTDVSVDGANAAFTVTEGLLMSRQGVLHTYPQGAGEEELTLPAGTVCIDAYAFTNDDSLITVVLPDTMVTIKSMAFTTCNALETVYVPRSVTDIQKNAFMSCPNVTLLVHAGSAAETWAKANNVPYELVATPASAFRYTNTGSAILLEGLADGADVTDLVIPATIEGLPVVMIRNDAFKGTAITSAVIPEGVTYVAMNAFMNCKSLASVTLPDSLRNIDANAFSGCAALTSVYIPVGVTAMSGNPFPSCGKLSSITVAEGSKAFKAVDNLLLNADGKLICYPNGLTAAEVTLPAGTTAIGNGAFTNNSTLQTLVLPDTLTAIEAQAFTCCMGLKTVVVPRSVTSIAGSAFIVCPNVTLLVYPGSAAAAYAQKNNIAYEYVATAEICFTYTNAGSAILLDGLAEGVTVTDLVIPETIEGLPVVMIRSDAFKGATITSAVIPEGVTYIAKNAFLNCKSLTHLELPESLASLDMDAFSGCAALTAVTIPAGVTAMSGNPFTSCNALASITVAEGNQAFKAVDNLLLNADGKLICYPNGLTAEDVTLPQDVTAIGRGAFTNNAAVRTLVLPGSVTAIEMQAFTCCMPLTTVTVPASVTSIAGSAVVVCPSMKWIVDTGSAAETYAKSNNIPYETTTPPETDAKYFSYSESNGEITLTGVSVPSDAGITDLVIPSAINGVPVTALSSDFNIWSAGATQVLVIPGSIREIGAICNWFQNDLHTVILMEGVEVVGDNAFVGSGASTVVLPSTLTTIGAGAFKQCANLTTVNIPASVTAIGDQAFVWGNASIKLTVAAGSVGEAYAISNGLGYVTE